MRRRGLRISPAALPEFDPTRWNFTRRAATASAGLSDSAHAGGGAGRERGGRGAGAGRARGGLIGAAAVPVARAAEGGGERGGRGYGWGGLARPAAARAPSAAAPLSIHPGQYHYI